MILLGALGWLPDVLLHAIRGYNFNSPDVWIIRAVMPLTLLVTFVAAKRTKGIESKWVGLLMVAGVWLLVLLCYKLDTFELKDHPVCHSLMLSCWS